MNAQVGWVSDAPGRRANAVGQVVVLVRPGTGGVFDQGRHDRGYVAEEEVSFQLMAGAALLLLLGPSVASPAG